MKTTDYTNLPAKSAKKMVDDLNVYLATLHVYYSNLRGFHWHVQGRSFFTLHVQLEKMYDTLVEEIDEVAERILQLDGVPVRIYSEVEKLSKLKQSEVIHSAPEIVKNVLDSYKVITKIERELIDTADELGDETTADQITGYLAAREKLAWMLTAYCTE